MQTASLQIRRAFINLKPREDWSFRDVGRSQTTAFTHNYHRYPAKFIPQIVRKLIEDYAPNGTQVVCDPFGGCCTTLVEAKLLGHQSIGFDINPVAKLITQTKTTPIRPKTLINNRRRFIEYYNNAPVLSHERHPRIAYWFESEVVQELDKIYFTINKNKIFPNPLETFLQHLDSMIRKNYKFYNALVESGYINVPAKMYRRDSTKKLPIDSDSIDLIIT